MVNDASRDQAVSTPIESRSPLRLWAVTIRIGIAGAKVRKKKRLRCHDASAERAKSPARFASSRRGSRPPSRSERMKKAKERKRRGRAKSSRP
jgi:hypothetical protein